MISIHESSFPTGPKGTFTEVSWKLETCASKSQSAPKTPAWKLLCLQNALVWNKRPFFNGQFFISFAFAKCRSLNMLTSNTWSQLSDSVQCGRVARLRFRSKESTGLSLVMIGTEGFMRWTQQFKCFKGFYASGSQLVSEHSDNGCLLVVEEEM